MFCTMPLQKPSEFAAGSRQFNFNQFNWTRKVNKPILIDHKSVKFFFLWLFLVNESDNFKQ